MAEHHEIAGRPRGEPLPEGRTGARVVVPLSGTPSPRWSRALAAQLTRRLIGRSAGRGLEVGGLVQGSNVVLEGVRDEADARQLGSALRDSVQAVNQAADRTERPLPPANMAQEQADRIAAALDDGGANRGGEEPVPQASAPTTGASSEDVTSGEAVVARARPLDHPP